ncbi:MAG: arginine--tRNA ligase [Candidatus Spechtbacteria bacterium]|nr:arginine--tRNA ligase [Candidatus Spechtbacteria bacterium]
MSPREQIVKIIEAAIKSAQKKEALPVFEARVIIRVPAEKEHGDYTTPIALEIAGAAHVPPRQIAEIIKKEIDEQKGIADIARVEIAGAGFLNFFLTPEFARKSLLSILASRNFGSSEIGKKKKLNLEFLSANPTGQVQVGNARLAFYGDVLGNILKYAGYSVTKEYYINNSKTSNQIQEFGKTALGQGEKYLTPYVEEKIAKLKTKLKRCKNAGEAGFLLATEVNKDNKQFLGKRAGVRFDVWFSEQSLYGRGLLKKTLALLKRKGLVYEKDGATWLRTTSFGDDEDKVLVRSTGEFGYYLADIAYHGDKIKRGYTTIIDVLGADHQGHVKPMQVAMEILGYKGIFNVIIGQLVQAKGGGKFSKRAGNAISLAELVKEVGIDATRFFYLTRSMDAQMEFDIDLAKSQTKKNPVYYIQYSHARISSILKKAQGSAARFGAAPNRAARLSKKNIPTDVIVGDGELALIKKLLRFQELIEDIARDYQVHHLTTYALELAQEFNQFYRDYKVLTNDGSLRQARLAITTATGMVLRNCLKLLGISAPPKM